MNGATVVACGSLLGNAILMARLTCTGNVVLLLPMEEDGQVFLPCCYGYAATRRRARGASLVHGCLCFDNKKPAGRGYDYVGVICFPSRSGVYLYGKLRRTDFLPDCPEKADKVLKRGCGSVSSDDENGQDLEHAFEEEGILRGGWRRIRWHRVRGLHVEILSCMHFE